MPRTKRSRRQRRRNWIAGQELPYSPTEKQLRTHRLYGAGVLKDSVRPRANEIVGPPEHPACECYGTRQRPYECCLCGRGIPGNGTRHWRKG